MGALKDGAFAELSRWIRSPSRFALLLAPFLATAFCLGVYSHRVVRRLPVAVVDQDRSGLSRTLARNLSAIPQMDVVALPDEAAVASAFRRGQVRAAVVLPEGLDREVRLGRTGRVVLLRDASNPMAANQIYSAMSSMVAAEGARLETGRLVAAGLPLAQGKEMALPLRADPRTLENPGLDYLANFAPGLFPMFLQMGLMLAAGSMLPGGWKGGASRREFLGRLVPWVVVDGALALFFYLRIVPALGGPHAPTLPTVALVGALVTVSVLFGGLVARSLSNPLQAMQMLLAFNTPAFPLSGYTFPEWAMPEFLRLVTRPLPFSLFVDGYRGFAGWGSDRAWVGILGLAAWALVAGLLVFRPGRERKVDDRASILPSSGPGLPSGWWATVLSEARRVVGTSGLSTLVFAAPVGYLALYGSMYALKEERRIPVAVVHGQESSLSREIVRSLDAHPALRAYPFGSSLEADSALRSGRVRAIVELPVDLDLRLRRRQATSIPLVLVADRFLPVNDIQRAVSEVLLWRGTQERLLIMESRGLAPKLAGERATALSLDDRPLANPRETYGDFMLPPLGYLVLHQLCLLSIAFSTAAAPRARRRRDLAARIVVFAPWFGLWCLLWRTGALSLFDVPIHPQVLPLLVLGALALVAVGSMGIALGIAARRPFVLLQLVAFSSYPFFFASGASWPREAFPSVVSALSRILPLSPWLAGTNRAIRLGAGLADVGPEILQLSLQVAGWAVVALLLARLSRRRLVVAS